MPIQGTVPSEILEGPAAIRATLDATESSVRSGRDATCAPGESGASG